MDGQGSTKTKGGGWTAVSPEANAAIIAADARGEGSVQYSGKVGSSRFTYETDLRTLRQTNLETKKVRLLRPPERRLALGGGGGAPFGEQEAGRWEVEADAGWVAFDAASQALLQAGVRQGIPEVSLTRGTNRYKVISTVGPTVDMAGLVQINLVTGVRRKIRQTAAPAREGPSEAATATAAAVAKAKAAAAAAKAKADAAAAKAKLLQEKIAGLEKKKLAAAAAEDYETAGKLKKEIAALQKTAATVSVAATVVTPVDVWQVELETGWVDMSEASQRLLRAAGGLVVKYVERSQNYVACTATLEQKNEDSGMVRRIRMKPSD